MEHPILCCHPAQLHFFAYRGGGGCAACAQLSVALDLYGRLALGSQAASFHPEGRSATPNSRWTDVRCYVPETDRSLACGGCDCSDLSKRGQDLWVEDQGIPPASFLDAESLIPHWYFFAILRSRQRLVRDCEAVAGHRTAQAQRAAALRAEAPAPLPAAGTGERTAAVRPPEEEDFLFDTLPASILYGAGRVPAPRPQPSELPFLSLRFPPLAKEDVSSISSFFYLVPSKRFRAQQKKFIGI